jgi:hypothetical protein
MGIWSALHVFCNDTSLDWLQNFLRNPKPEKVYDAIIPCVSGDQLDMGDVNRALAACEIIAWAYGQPGYRSSTTYGLWEWSRSIDPSDFFGNDASLMNMISGFMARLLVARQNDAHRGWRSIKDYRMFIESVIDLYRRLSIGLYTGKGSHHVAPSTPVDDGYNKIISILKAGGGAMGGGLGRPLAGLGVAGDARISATNHGSPATKPDHETDERVDKMVEDHSIDNILHNHFQSLKSKGVLLSDEDRIKAISEVKRSGIMDLKNLRLDQKLEFITQSFLCASAAVDVSGNVMATPWSAPKTVPPAQVPAPAPEPEMGT